MSEVSGKIIITLGSDEPSFEYATYGLSYNSTNEEVVNAIAGALSEIEPGFDLVDEYAAGNFSFKRVDKSQNTYIFPKSTLGVIFGRDKLGHFISKKEANKAVKKVTVKKSLDKQKKKK